MDTLLVTIITSSLVSGIIVNYFQAKFKQSTQIVQKEQELKEKRYLCIIILMLTTIKPENGLLKIKMLRPDLKSKKDIENELQTEFLHAFIFANDKVLNAFATFIKNPNYDNFVLTVSRMRKDLWGRKAKMKEDTLKNLIQDLK